MTTEPRCTTCGWTKHDPQAIYCSNVFHLADPPGVKKRKAGKPVRRDLAVMDTDEGPLPVHTCGYFHVGDECPNFVP